MRRVEGRQVWVNWIVTIAIRVLASLDAPHGRLGRSQFHLYIEQLTANLPHDKAEEFMEMLSASVKVCSWVV